MSARGDVYYIENTIRRMRLNGNWRVLGRGGLGAPVVQWITNQNARVGERVVGFRIPPRLVSLSLYRRSVPTISQYHALRAQLIEMVNPLNSDPLYFDVHLANGQRRRLNLRYDSGADFAAQNIEELANFNINATLSFIAHDPFFYDPIEESFDFTATEIGALFYPFEYPIEYSGSGVSFVSDELNYIGQNLWRTYPRIVIDGPYSTATVTNEATGAFFELTVAIDAGEQRIISLSELERSIVDENGDSRFGELSDESTLLNFFISPNVTPQRVRISLSGAESGVSAASLSYNRRFFGI